MKKTGRIALLALGIMAALLLLAMPAFADSYSSRVTSFINDSRWCNGTWWGNGKRPEVSTYDCSTCFAYAADFSKQVWASHPNWFGVNGVYFTDFSQVRDGDVIHISNHYYVVLQRTGNTLWTAEGNCDQHVRISKTVYNASSASALGGFINGWHNPNYETYVPNTQPLMEVEMATGGVGVVEVKGWAFDPDAPDKMIPVHFYTRDSAGNMVALGAVTANEYHHEMGVTYQAGPYHGFSGKFYTAVSGSVTLAVAALDYTDGGNNAKWVDKSIYITGDTTPPTISNIQITNVSSAGYTVNCDVSDNVAIDRVVVPAWSLPNGQDDLISGWEKNAIATLSGNHATYRVNTSAHNNEAGCTYATHIYVYDKAGNATAVNQSMYPVLGVYVPTPDEASFGTPDFVLPSSLTRIADSAFEGISATVVYIPDTCRSIGQFAFRNSSVKKIRIPAKCAIWYYAFDGCTDVKIYSEAGSLSEDFCKDHSNCTFIAQ